MEPIEQLSHILPKLKATVDRIQVMQMNDPTPCSEFTVHDVLNHMIVLGGSFSYWFRGEEAPEPGPSGVYGWVPTAEFREAMDGLFASVTSPGAMERLVKTPMGEMPGETFARLVAFDGLVHGWDLASSTGQDYELPDNVIAAVDEFARSAVGPDMRDGDTFKDATCAPEGASQLERLIAFSGRSL
jgi:uncharacterized protein (TIGR03086 family)